MKIALCNRIMVNVKPEKYYSNHCRRKRTFRQTTFIFVVRSYGSGICRIRS